MAFIPSIEVNGFGLRLSSVGPIKFVNLCGLDTILNIQKYLYTITNDPVHKPSRAIEERARRGDLGAKTGKGFYEYPDDEADTLRR